MAIWYGNLVMVMVVTVVVLLPIIYHPLARVFVRVLCVVVVDIDWLPLIADNAPQLLLMYHCCMSTATATDSTTCICCYCSSYLSDTVIFHMTRSGHCCMWDVVYDMSCLCLRCVLNNDWVINWVCNYAILSRMAWWWVTVNFPYSWLWYWCWMSSIFT